MFLEAMQQLIRPLRTHPSDPRPVQGRDDRNRQSRSKMCKHRQYTAHLPRRPHTLRFVPFWPEQVKKERCSEDGRHGYAGEDVVRPSPDVVIVVDVRSRVNGLDVAFHVDVCWLWVSIERLPCKDEGRCRQPYSTARPSPMTPTRRKRSMRIDKR